MIRRLLVAFFVLIAVPVAAQNFTVEINRAQPDAITITVAKSSANGQAFTAAMERANVERVAQGLQPYASEPAYLQALLAGILQDWRKQQLDVGVRAAFEAANDALKLQVRALLGLP